MSIRTKRRLIALAYHGAVLTFTGVGIHLGESFHHEPIARFFAGLFVFHLATFRLFPITRLLQQALIRQARCPRCGLLWPLVADWSCGCGYTRPRAYHLFRPCAYCGRLPAMLTCERCGVSILL